MITLMILIIITSKDMSYQVYYTQSYILEA